MFAVGAVPSVTELLLRTMMSSLGWLPAPENFFISFLPMFKSSKEADHIGASSSIPGVLFPMGRDQLARLERRVDGGFGLVAVLQ